MRSQHGESQRGSVTVELAVGLVALLILLGFLGLLGRIITADGLVAQAAREAARAATLERTAPAASAAAEHTATQVLTSQELQCASLDITANVSAFATPVGTPGSVDVAVTCDVGLHDLPVPWANQYSASAEASSVLDTYRERE